MPVKLNIYTPTSDLQIANVPYMLVLLVRSWHAKDHMYKLVWSIWRYGIHIWPNLNRDAGSDNWLQIASSAIHVQVFFYLICEVGQIHQKNLHYVVEDLSLAPILLQNLKSAKTSNLSEHFFFATWHFSPSVTSQSIFSHICWFLLFKWHFSANNLIDDHGIGEYIHLKETNKQETRWSTPNQAKQGNKLQISNTCVLHLFQYLLKLSHHSCKTHCRGGFE